MEKRPCLSEAVIEMISNIIGDTQDGLTGSEIHHLLLQSGIDDISKNEEFMAKRKKLYNALANFQNKNQCSNNILKFIQLVLTPSRFANTPANFDAMRTGLNKQLAFAGYEVYEDGKFHKVSKANSLSDIDVKVENIKGELVERNTHPEIFKYCTKELIANNYFHAVFEANKGLFQRIRELSGLSTDGNALIEEVFSSNPILIINNYQTKSEKDEHAGFCNILKGLCSMFRNTGAHEPEIYWPIEKQDALEILGIISYCHRRLDKAHKIR